MNHTVGQESSSSGKHLGRFAKGKMEFIGEVDADEVLELTSRTMMDVIDGHARRTGKTYRLDELRVRVPIDRPSKIICIGLNYKSHIKEMGSDVPEKPIIFTKPSSAIIGHLDQIVMPRASSRVDFEGEAAIVIGKRASQVKNGTKYIFGYTCINDVTARDLQKIDVDWTRAKGFDTFAPIGPVISTKAPNAVTTRLNGRVVQNADLSDRVFDDRALIEYISTIMTLEPGDIIATGTPSGIAPMSDGDMVEVELDTVGTLTNQVVKSL